MGRVETLASARQKLRNAEMAFECFLTERFPEGAEIRWTKREYIQVGEVVGHGRESVRVRNYTTDKKYWIDSYFIIDRKVSPHGQ